MTAPLEGIVVVSLEAAISAPFATRQLADLGATVVKVERPEGDFARHYDSVVEGESAFFVWANRGKQSVVLDVKDDDDLAMLRALIAGADVFLHNLSPRAAMALGPRPAGSRPRATETAWARWASPSQTSARRCTHSRASSPPS